jgi:DNA uptake protein ComE-like DNA-binding protein
VTATPDDATRQDRLERRIEDVLRLQEQNGRQQSALTAAIESLRVRVDTLEKQLAEVSSRGQRDELVDRAAGYQEAHPAAALPEGGEPIDLNAADFDQLRAVGLSITQAARLIARRDSVNGFSSEAEVAALPGFPQSLLQDLLSKTRL